MSNNQIFCSVSANVHNYFFGDDSFWPSAIECGERPERVRVRIPSCLADSNTVGCPEVTTGYLLVGFHRGRKWGVVKFYDKWLRRDGVCRGFFYVAYDLSRDAAVFEKIAASFLSRS